jgi:hypothetical protein
MDIDVSLAPLTDDHEVLTPNLDLLEALRSGVATTVLGAVQGDDEVGIVVVFTTSSETGSVESGSSSEVPLDGAGRDTEGGEGGNSDGGEEHF